MIIGGLKGVSNLELIFITEKTTYKCILSASTPWFAMTLTPPLTHNLNIDSLIWDRRVSLISSFGEHLVPAKSIVRAKLYDPKWPNLTQGDDRGLYELTLNYFFNYSSGVLERPLYLSTFGSSLSSKMHNDIRPIETMHIIWIWNHLEVMK